MEHNSIYIAVAFISGAIISWFIKHIVDITLKGKLTKILNSHLPIIRPKKIQASHRAEFFKIGGYVTSLCLIDGDGEAEYSVKTIDALFHDGAPDSPDDISDRILKAEIEMERTREAGNSEVWDGIGVGIRQFNILRDDNEDNLALSIHFYKSRYAAFRATVVEIGKEDRKNPDSIYQNYLKNCDPREPIDFLARHVGIVAVVITADNQILVTKRSGSTGARKNEYDVSFVEGIEPTKDADLSGSRARINTYQAVQRGCREELGFLPEIDQIKLIGFGVDMDFYQFNFLAVIRSEMTYDAIRTNRNGRAKDSWESKITPLQYKVDDVLYFINKHRMWGFASTLLYLSLFQEYSRLNIEARAVQIVTRTDEYRIAPADLNPNIL